VVSFGYLVVEADSDFVMDMHVNFNVHEDDDVVFDVDID